MHRFFTSQTTLAQQTTISLTDPDEVHHLKCVLRLKSGDEVHLFNENGQEATAHIQRLDAKSVTLAIVECRTMAPTKSPQIILACAIPKKAKFESIIEKTTELGVTQIIPLLTARTEVRIKGEEARRKADRYRKVAINAAKQCQRNSIPIIDPPTTFDDVLKKFLTGETLILIPCLCKERSPMTAIFRRAITKPRILILIGPEGDFTEAEISKALAAGAIPVSLGETVLKVDTAAMSAVAVARLHTSDPENESDGSLK